MLKRASDGPGPYGAGAVESAESRFDSPSNDGGGINLREYIRIARRRGPIVVAIAILSGLMGAVYALQLTPLYTASATILIDPRKQNVAGGEAVLSGFDTSAETIASQIELMKSRDVVKRAVEKLKLNEQQNEPKEKDSVIGLIWSQLFNENQQEKPENDLALEQDTLEPTISAVQSAMGVARKGFSYILALSFTSPNPGMASAVANTLAEEYLVDQLEAKYNATKRATDWLNDRLGELKSKVEDSERAVEVFRAENNLVKAQGTTLSDTQVAKLNEQLILARAETAQAKVKLDQVREVTGRGGDPSSFAEGLNSGVLGGLRSRASEARRELAELSSKYGARHPSVVSARAQLADVVRQIGAEAERIIAAAENEYRVALSREQSISKSMEEMKGTTSELSQAEIKLRDLERDAAANRSLYESFLARFKETSQQETLQTPDSRIVERASTPSVPSAPNKNRIIILWGMLGLSLGGGLAYLLEKLDSGFRTNEQIERELGTPVLGVVPRAEGAAIETRGLLQRINIFAPLARLIMGRRSRGGNKRMGIARLVHDNPLSQFTEAIRALRMGIRFANVDRPAKIVLVTSALPSEGKSIIASNLAQQAAMAGERVLLIDMDLRHPVTTAVYAPDAKQGLVEVITENFDLSSVLRMDQATGLTILPSPRAKGLTHTAEILGSQRVRDFLTQMARSFDLIVVDSSPLLPVTDGRALIDAVDGVVLVVRWEKTQREAVLSAIRQSHGLRDRLLGVVFNDVVARRARHYDYYKSGYYMKKYPHYYGATGKA